MSWSGYLTIPKGTDTEEADRLLKELSVTGNDQTEDVKAAREEQVRAARNAARVMLASEAVGQVGECSLVVTISGHANPGHAPADGYGNDTISVTVSQLSEAPAQKQAPGYAVRG